MNQIENAINRDFKKVFGFKQDLSNAEWIDIRECFMFPKLNNIEYKNFQVSSKLIKELGWINE